MKNALALQVAKIVVPMLLASFGTWLAVAQPAMHKAICEGKA